MDAGERFETRPVATARRGRGPVLVVVGVAAALVAIGLAGPKASAPRGTLPSATMAIAIADAARPTRAPRASAGPSGTAAIDAEAADPGRSFDLGHLGLARTPAGLLPPGPADLAVGFGSVWIATDADGILRRLDAATLEVLATVALPRADTTARRLDVIIGGEAVWVAGPDPGTIHRIDGTRPAAGSRIDLGGAGTLVVSGFRGLWAGREDGALVRIDLRRSGQTSVLDLGSPAVALAVGGDAVWASTVAGELLRIDPSGRRITARFDAGGGRIAVGPGRLWVANAGVMSAVDEATGRLEAVDRGWRVAFDAELFTQPPDRRESRISPNRPGLALALGAWWRWDPVTGQLARVPRRGG
ncbi:MAG TPA: hypothetical protein VFK54_08665 [Candidatus Limnocylindrales bacterium]|nr:hypothetical protein [Candidatus Limnocylindrales bacterium]